MPDAYLKLGRAVDRLLARYGKDCELVTIITGGYNPATGSVDPDHEETYTARAVEVAYTLENMAQTLVQTGNKVGCLKVTDEAFTGEIDLSMKIRLEGDHLRNLREVQPMTPGTSLLYWRFVAGG